VSSIRHGSAEGRNRNLHSLSTGAQAIRQTSELRPDRGAASANTAASRWRVNFTEAGRRRLIPNAGAAGPQRSGVWPWRSVAILGSSSDWEEERVRGAVRACLIVILFAISGSVLAGCWSGGGDNGVRSNSGR